MTQGIPQQVLRSPKAMTQIAEEQLENVFSVTFCDLGSRSGLNQFACRLDSTSLFPMCATSKAKFADRHQGR